jgi:hypothetical protein
VCHAELQPFRTTFVVKTNQSNMRNLMTIFFLLLSVMFSHLKLMGQENNHEKKWFSKHPVDFSFGSASVGMPFTNFFKSPFYPMISAGTEFYYKRKDKFDFYQSARLNYYYAKYSTSGVVLNSEVGFRYKFNFSWFADVGLGVGYAHLFRPNAVFKLNDNDEYEQVTDWGAPRLETDFFISAGYDLSRNSKIPLSLYVKYGNYLDILYAPDISLLPHNIFQIGVRYYFIKK